jgi:hypothetical protein
MVVVSYRLARVAAMVSLSLVATACIRRQTDPVTGKTDIDIESPFKKGEDFKATIAGTPSFAGITGRATIRSVKGKTTISVTAEGLAPYAPYPWHLHDGTCETGGPVVGDASAYTPLNAGADGKAQATATIAMKLNEAQKYHVNIHRSPMDLATIIACGNVAD